MGQQCFYERILKGIRPQEVTRLFLHDDLFSFAGAEMKFASTNLYGPLCDKMALRTYAIADVQLCMCICAAQCKSSFYTLWIA